MVTKDRIEIFLANSEKQNIQMALRELKIFLDKIYGPNSPEMWVYRSYARQEETLQSDIDVLLLYPKKIHPGQEVERISPVLAELNLRYQFLISILPVSERITSKVVAPFGPMFAEKECTSMAKNSILEKAERFIDSSEVLANDGDYDSAASRLYYAMFYIAQALLDARGLSFSSHKGVISAFGQHLAKTQEPDSRFHQALIAAYGQRQLGDYAINSGLRFEDIEKKAADAKDFLTTA